jgi:hypothetical protein
MAKFVLNGDGLTKAQTRWRERAKKLMAAQPKSFRGAMKQVEKADRLQLDRMVYSSLGKGKRSGELRRAEKLEWEDRDTALITNDAASEWNGAKKFYAWWVAEGRKARTKAQGCYLWMTDPRAPRPGNKVAWGIALAMGLAHRTKKMKAMPRRPWRLAAIRAARHFIPLAARQATKEVMED